MTASDDWTQLRGKRRELVTREEERCDGATGGAEVDGLSVRELQALIRQWKRL
jgi:hypothetical protein